MIGRNPIFQPLITEHPRLQLLIVSTHPRFLPQLPCGIAVVVQQPLRVEAVRQVFEVASTLSCGSIWLNWNNRARSKSRASERTGINDRPDSTYDKGQRMQQQHTYQQLCYVFHIDGLHRSTGAAGLYDNAWTITVTYSRCARQHA